MGPNRVAVALLIAGGLAIAWPLAASAQAMRTWVAAAGNDANPCTRVAPCVSLDVAMSKTAAYGEVDCAGPVEELGGTITKSIMINCDGGGVEAGGVAVQAGANDVVILRGLRLTSEPQPGGFSDGVVIFSAASVIVDHCVISLHGGFGIEVENAANNTHLVVHDTLLAGNGAYAIVVVGGGINRLSVTDTVMAGNGGGLQMGISGTSAVSGAVSHTVISNGGIFADAGGSPPGQNISVMIDDSTVTGGFAGIDVEGAPAGLIVGRTSVTGASIGVRAIQGAVVYSYGDNTVNGNGADGVFTATIPTR
jgi:hypothetical protein